MPDDVHLTGETPTPVETPVTEQPVPEDSAATSATTETPHPLEPGGDRFKEVWARAKKAEEREKVERENRIRAEERAKVLEEVKPTSASPAAQPEYGWDQLQKWIDAGQITLGQAMEYREQRVAAKVAAEAESKSRHEFVQQQQMAFVNGELAKFIAAIPSLHDMASPQRMRAEQEFAYALAVDGVSDASRLDANTKRRYELKALRAAFGDLASIAASNSSERETRSNRETHMETTSSGGTTNSSSKDPLKSLDAAQRKHYERMIAHGRYRDPSGKKSAWDLVREELASADKYAQRSLR